MNIDALKQQLAEGKITKEQFAAELKKLLDAGTMDQVTYDAAIAEANQANDPPPNNGFTDEQMAAIQKMMQSEADKVRTKAALEKKALEDQLDKIKTDKMTEEEKAKHEMDKLRKQNEETAAELLKDKVGFHTVKTLSAKDLPLDFDVFLAGSTVEDTDARIAAFEKGWQTAIKTAVDAKFAAGGGDPLKDKGGGGTAKTWKDMSVDEKGKMFKEDPTKARELAKAAGVNL